ncbi:PIG-L deacetylase family protein [Solicola sp. PLA-1-18]|uniref:PIG-L deacetylase family protein n=1 Tax=Solicola sp. PLA-1-18 TaxID=3380532 RepID=UPI003B7B5642
MDVGEPATVVPVPRPGLVRETVGPERTAVVWSDRPVDVLLDALAAAGYLPVRLPPAETAVMAEVTGPPSLLLVAAEHLDDATLAALAEVRERSRQTRVVLLAGPSSASTHLLTALRVGLSEVVDPDDAAAVAVIVAPPDDAASRERVLAIGAHPDDVEIGCGATLLRHRAVGQRVSVLTLSRGAVGGDKDARRREAVNAAVAMGAELLLADLDDTRLADAPDLIPLIEEAVRLVDPTTVYVHSAHDSHQDHRAVHVATVSAARRVPELLCYQSPSATNEFAPTRLVPVDDTVHAKVDVLAHYRSQAARPYLEPDLVVAATRYWARQLAPRTRYAEPFEVLRSSGPAGG